MHLVRNDGSGSFSAAGALPTVTSDDGWNFAVNILAEDFDDDGDADLALLRWYPSSDSSLVLFRNRGDGTFAPRTEEHVRGQQISLFAADLDADGDHDLVSAGYYFPVTAFVNDGAGGFSESMQYDAGFNAPGGTAWNAAAGDVNGDGVADVVQVNAVYDRVYLFLGSDAPAPRISSVSPMRLDAGDEADVAIDGTDFGAGPSVDFGPGIDVTQVRRESEGRIVASVRVRSVQELLADPDVFALLNGGEYDATIELTGPDRQCDTAPLMISLGPGPRVFSVAPAQVELGSVTDLVVTGLAFDEDVTAELDGASVVSVRRVSETELRVRVAVSSDAASGSVPLTVTNGTGAFTRVDGFEVVEPGIEESLELTGVHGHANDRRRFRRDALRATATLRFGATSPDGTFSPATDDVTLLVGSPDGPLVITIPADDPRWRLQRGRYRWQSPRRARPRVRLTIDPERSLFDVKVSRAEFPVPLVDTLLIDLRAGNDRGSAVRPLERRRGRFDVR